ncbi:MAG: dTMP kinase [Candidatus Nanohaloarchaea archaeon]
MRRHDFPGKLIVVEGADGSGTTTQAERLTERLGGVYTAEHGERRSEQSLIGRKVEQMISEQGYSPEAVALGFAADRIVHLEEKLIQLLKDGKSVVCDRYYHSSLVYQPAMGADFEWVKEINREAIVPDTTFILDVSAEVGMERLDQRGRDQNIFEEMSFQQEVVERYRRLPESLDENIELIDGTESKDEVEEAIKSKISD